MNDNDNVQIIIQSDPFSMLPNDLIRDNNISNDAKALYAIIKSYIGIPNFILYKQTLFNSFKGGDYKFRNAWKELKDLGYLIQFEDRSKGKFTYKYKLLSKPVDDKPLVVQPLVDNPHADNQHSYKELINNNDLNNNELDTVLNNINKARTNELERTDTVPSNEQIDPINNYEDYVIRQLSNEQYKAYTILLEDVIEGRLDSTKGNLLKYFEKMMNNGWKRDSDNQPIFNIVGHVRSNFTANSKNRKIAEKGLREMGLNPYDYSYKNN